MLTQYPLLTTERKQKLYSYAKNIISEYTNNNYLNFNRIHGATENCLENEIYILVEHGITAEDKEFYNIFHPLVKLFASTEINSTRKQNNDDNSFDFSHNFIINIIADLLITAGFTDTCLLDYLRSRLDTISKFCKKMNYDIYCKPDENKGIPKPFRQYPVVKPEIINKCNYYFPIIYDIYAYKTIYKSMSSSEKTKVNIILKYILSEQYQKLYEGYGILKAGPSHYYAIGWDVRLPIQDKNSDITFTTLHRLELLATFPYAVKHEWFKDNYKRLSQYKIDKGIYLLPRQTLPEKDRYWLIGAHKSLGENRRTTEGYIQNSTYRINNIQNTCGIKL